MRLPIETLKSLLSYDKHSGHMTWLKKAKQGGSRNAGEKAGHIQSDGYVRIMIQRKHYFAHQLAWALHHNEWPTNTIDHINQDRADNRITNLRDVTQSENQRNATLQVNNKCGVTGVSYSAKTGKWYACIWVAGRNLNLGYHDTIFEAAAARKAANVRFGYHENHGRRAA